MSRAAVQHSRGIRRTLAVQGVSVSTRHKPLVRPAIFSVTGAIWRRPGGGR